MSLFPVELPLEDILGVLPQRTEKGKCKNAKKQKSKINLLKNSTKRGIRE